MDNQKYVLVTDWEHVAGDDFYISYKYTGEEKETIKEARKLQREGKLYYGYIVEALAYCVYYQMDSHAVLIDKDSNVIINCESSVINNQHKHREEFNYE